MNNELKHKVLVVYFSKTGEQYSVGNISKGNTEIAAEMAARRLKGDLFEIKVIDDEYPNTYNALVTYAKNEKQQGLRPEILGRIQNFSEYDTIVVAFPNWWSDMPMPVYSFLESYDFTSKTVIPLCTHEGSGLSNTKKYLEDTTKAKTLDGLALYGHIAQNSQEEARKLINNWLDKLGY